MLVTAQRILIGCIVGLFPLLVYVMLLIGLNSRKRASMIPGAWDFAGVLLASSGFLLGGGPLILIGFNGGWRRLVFHGNFADWRRLSGEGDVLAMTVWAIFFIAVVGGAAILISRRRQYTILYNVDVAHFGDALEWIFGRLGIVWRKTEKGYELQRLRENVRTPWRQPLNTRDMMDKNLLVQTSTLEADVRSVRAALQVSSLASSCNVTLHWAADDGDIRRLVEGELHQLLANIRAEQNPAVQWLLTVSTMLFGLIIAAMVFVILTTVRLRGAFG